MQNLNKSYSFIVFFGCTIYALFIAKPSQAQLIFRNVTINNNFSNWTLSPVITEAGNNYNSEFNSTVGQMKIGIGVPILSKERISVKLVSSNWSPNLNLFLRRQGIGSTLLCVNCAVNGGTAFIPVTNTEVEFFQVTTLLHLLVFTDVELQLKLTGASVTIPADNYNANIVFTIGPL